MRRLVVGAFLLSGASAAFALASCVGDVAVPTDSGADVAVIPDSGPGFCERHRSDPGLLLCADFDDGTLGGLAAAKPGNDGVVEIVPSGFSPPNAVHVSMTGLTKVSGASVSKAFATVTAPVSASLSARVKPSPNCLPSSEPSLGIAAIGAGDVGLGVAVRTDTTYLFASYGNGAWELSPTHSTSALVSDQWSAVKLDVTITSTLLSGTLTVEGNAVSIGGAMVTAKGSLAFHVGPSNALGGLDGGAGTGYTNPCDMLIDDVLVVNTN